MVKQSSTLSMMKNRLVQKNVNKIGNRRIVNNFNTNDRMVRSYGVLDEYRNTVNEWADSVGLSNDDTVDSEMGGGRFTRATVSWLGSFWKRLPLKTKLIIISTGVVIFFIVIFIVVLVPSLITSGLIEIPGVEFE